MSFNINLMRLLANANLTHRDLGDKLGVSYQTIGKWVRGNAYPQADRIPGLCRALGTTPNELFGYDTDVRGQLESLRQKIREQDRALADLRKRAGALENPGCDDLDCVRSLKHTGAHWNGRDKYWGGAAS